MSGVPGITYEAHLGSRTEIRIVDLETRQPLPVGQRGHFSAGTTDYAGVLSKPGNDS